MKVALFFLLVVAAVSAVDEEVLEINEDFRDASTEITLGDISPDDRLLTNVIIRRAPTLCAIPSTFTRSIAPNVITAIRGFEVGATQFAIAELVGGGVGETFVAIRLTNAPVRGFDFQIQLWGREGDASN